MQQKLCVLLTTIILLSFLLAPAGGVQAQHTAPDCLPYEPGLLTEREFLRSLPLECISEYKETARETNPTATGEADVENKLSGGPDSFGYTYNDAVPYSWISATTNSGLSGYDQFTGPINIGFNFPFYGMPQTQLFFNTNGLITFGAGSPNAGGYATSQGVDPNNLIAPFWNYLVVGSPYNSGAIYYSQGGSAPNRYFVVEWRNITLDTNQPTTPFSFEAVLYENGDIVFQYQSLPASFFVNFVGIEDSVGYQQLRYGAAPTAPKAVRFYYPATSTARLLVSPLLQTGGFAPLNGYKAFPVKVINPGTLGADTYDLSKSSTWPVTFYAPNGVTPLTDTDSDGLIDTGPLPQGTSMTVMARVSAPGGAQIGANSMATVTITSSLDASKAKTIYLFTSIPTNFASVFQDEANGAMSFMTTDPYGTSTSKATADHRFGYEVAVTPLTNNNYFYAWYRHHFDGAHAFGYIEYALLGRTGNIIRPAAILANDSSPTQINYDDAPSVATAPNGTVGVVWVRNKHDLSTGKFNYNIYFATLNTAGNLLTGPTNITNHTVWSTIADPVITRFRTPSIAATDDNRFVIAWTNYTRTSGSPSEYDVWYAVRNTAGTNIYAPHPLTVDHANNSPVLNSLTGGKVILTWSWNYGDLIPQYKVINSDGTFVTVPATDYFYPTSSQADAVQLANGKVAIAWPTYSGVRLTILNSSYLPESTSGASTPVPTGGDLLSVTTDASSRVVMTWSTGEAYQTLYYALANSNGAFVTPPMIYQTSGSFIERSWNGQGNAPYQSSPVISGQVGVADATLSYTGGSTTADSAGYYSISVPSGWSGTVTPSKSGYVFSPSQRTYSNVTTNQAAQNYTATAMYSISGNAGVAGVTLSYTDGTPKTVLSQPDGSYSFTVPANWSGTVTPSHACFTFTPASRSYSNLNANQTAQGFAPTLLPGAGCADINVSVGGGNQGRFVLPPQGSTRVSFPAINNGPVLIESTNAIPVMAAERLIYKVGGVNTSFSEMMGLPNGQLDNTYWLPWYNNVDLDTQLRIGNVSGSTATVHIFIGPNEVTPVSGITLLAGGSTRVSYAGINNGPVKIVSDQNIVAAERLIYKVSGVATSFSEMMALPNNALDTTYWLPWYNNVDLDTQLRIGNVSGSTATVHIFIGPNEVTPVSGITLPAGGSTRLSYAGINNGPVKIVSDVPIVAAERLIYKVGGKNTSFSEMMALPNSKLDTTYWLPWYNNVDLDTQLRFANVHASQTAQVHVFIGGVEMPNSPFTLLPGESTRKSFAGINNGPVQIVSNVPIVAAERLIYKVGGVNTSFSEMMALPNTQLDTLYWLPWYNNVDLDTQLRFGVP